MGTPVEPPELFDLRMSEAARPLFDRVTAVPRRRRGADAGRSSSRWRKTAPERWGYAAGQLDLLDAAKAKAKAAGLWNFFLPDSEVGGLSNLDYAYIAVELGKYPLGSECLNCSAPDTGNMEVLERVGTPEQKKQWLEPLLAGEIRSAYAMTEPDLASSDAKNISLSAVRDGDEYVLNGEKYYISGAGDPRCKIMIVMCKTEPGRVGAQAAVADPRADGHARRRDPRADARVRSRRRAARSHAPAIHRRPRAGGEHAARRGPRLRDQPGSPRSRSYPSLHARRSVRARGRSS